MSLSAALSWCAAPGYAMASGRRAQHDPQHFAEFSKRSSSQAIEQRGTKAREADRVEDGRIPDAQGAQPQALSGATRTPRFAATPPREPGTTLP